MVILVVHMKKKWINDNNGEKITLYMALVLLSMMEYGTCCAIHTWVVINPIPQDSMASAKPTHKCFRTNYLPLIRTIRRLSSTTLI